ncbi:hypothetical protein NL676_022041 [Syzygium grande]|nr:hypothetical protein NL676_022041 [Syzygium grande]
MGRPTPGSLKGKVAATPIFFKELVSNASLGVNMDWSRPLKSVLIMDKVDGMPAGVAHTEPRAGSEQNTNL